MKKSKRFEPIHAIASNSADELSRAMAEAAERVNELERQLEQLKAYRDDYVRNAAPAGAAMDAVKLHNYRSFIARLGDALRQQASSLEAAHAEHDRRRRLWSEKRIEAQSLERVVERFRAEERGVTERHEQQEADAAALRIAQAGRESGG